MPKKLSKEKFVEKSTVIHSNKYDYSFVNYVNNTTKVEIICLLHGSFWQLPSAHLQGKACQKCGLNIYSLSTFIKKANKIHNNFYNYDKSNYKKSTSKIKIICPIHGEFSQIASYHLQGKCCPRCGWDKKSKSSTLTQEEFIEKANLKHNFKYEYSKSIYIKSSFKITIICPIHGEFQQRAYNHLAGKGCSKCNHKPIYSKSEWIDICNSKSCLPTLYIIRCFNQDEEFVKIGITCQSIYNRFLGKSKFPYSYEIIKEIKGSPDIIYDKETELHKIFKHASYTPLLSFPGQTECFNISILDKLNLNKKGLLDFSNSPLIFK